MARDLRERLKKKGWSDEEIERALEIMYSEDKPSTMKKRLFFQSKTQPLIYWISVIIAIIGNLLVSIAIVPYLFILSYYSYFIISLLGISLGTLFAFLLKDLDQIDPKHHIISWIFIPSLAIINFYYSVKVSNYFQEITNIGLKQNPLLVALTYVVFFVIPFIIIAGKEYFEKGKHY